MTYVIIFGAVMILPLIGWLIYSFTNKKYLHPEDMLQGERNTNKREIVIVIIWLLILIIGIIWLYTWDKK